MISNEKFKRLADKWRVMRGLGQMLAGLSHSEIRQVGAVIFSPDITQIIGTGYNGPAIGQQARTQKQIGSQSTQETHSEVNALIKSNLRDCPRKSLVMFVSCPPCVTCARYIINSEAIGFVLYDHQEEASYAGVGMIAEANIGCFNANELYLVSDLIDDISECMFETLERWKAR